MIAGFGEVAERLRRSTVQVIAGRDSSGSGVIWDERGAIVTNAHVARTALLTVKLWDGRTFEGRVEKTDPRRDLALVRIKSGGLHPIAIGESRRLRVGEVVIAVGNPLGFVGALSTGVVHGIGPVSEIGSRDFIQAAIRLAPGNSGGPLADSSGRLVGINTMVIAGRGGPDGLALAIPSQAVERFLARGEPAHLGVSVTPVRIESGNRGIGWVVIEIRPGSPAERSSLIVGDILTGINGGPFRTMDDLAEAIDNARNGLVRLKFLRGGQSQSREVTVRLSQEVAA